MSEGAAPQNLDAEEAVLGAILLAGACALTAAAEVVAAGDFYRASHNKIFAAAVALAASGAVDPITLADELERRGQLEEVGGRARIAELGALVPAAGNVRHYAFLVADAARRREMDSVGAALRRAAHNGGSLSAEVRDRVTAVLRGATSGIRVRGVVPERVRPMGWLWLQRIPLGVPSLLVGEEGVGKGTFTSWLVARTTLGELDGDRFGKPAKVLIIGDEDAFEPVWVPRLFAAGAKLEMLRTLDDGEALDDLAAVGAALEVTLAKEQIGLVVLDALLDHIPSGAAGEGIYNPKNIRNALMPLRRAIAATNVAALGLLHPIKGNPTSFRQLVAGSHQFNAVSRSSLWLAADPENSSQRVLVRGKGNLSAPPRAIEFSIVGKTFQLNGHTFEMPMVVDVAESDRTVEDLLNAAPAAPVRDGLANQLEPLLTEEEKPLAAFARELGRSPKDGSVRNAFKALETAGKAKRGKKGWRRP